MTRCAFLGLGVMGYPMAGHLARAGHEVSVWNRTSAKAQKWADEYTGRACEKIEEAVTGADYVMICVGDDPDVFAVVEPALEAMAEGAIIVDHTTASADCARKCEAMAKEKNIGFVDAPISGGEAGAVSGQLTIMSGGNQDAYDKAMPIMDTYAKAVKLMGPSGAGQLTKMVNQICIAGLLQGLAEGLHFAQKAGLDVGEWCRLSVKGLRKAGRWIIGPRRWLRMNMSLALPLIGCVKTSALLSKLPRQSGLS